jgi:serine/threonine protein kinase
VAAGATDFQGANEQPPADVQEQGALQGECAKSSAAPAPAEAAVSLEGSDVQIENFFDKVVTIGCDRVRLLHPIGQGSYGSVYKGQLMKQGSSDSAATADASKGGASSSSSSSSAGQYVAVKVFPACKEPPGDKHSECGCCLSFQRERNALQLLRREVGVVQLQAVGAVMHLDPAAAASCGNRIDGSSSSSSAQRQRQEQLVRRPCLVMELADGTLESDVRHSEQEVCVLMVPPLKGLTVMQSCAAGRSRNAKVVHRDIKPANILRTAAGPKICDFSNCAIWRGQALRCLKMETVVGTPLYMPVEMRDPDGKCYTSDVDCHSMGLVALALLLGGSAALEQRVRSHWSRTVEGWLADFYDYEEVPLEQGISSQARDFVRCCCLLRQRAQQLLQHEWLREARVAARASQHGAAEG